MKKLIKYLFLALLFTSFSVAQLKAESVPTPITPTEKVENTEVQPLINRLNEIKEMDKSDLSRTDRRSLRREVRGLKKEIAENNGGVYLSVGAVILIVLLLIILL